MNILLKLLFTLFLAFGLPLPTVASALSLNPTLFCYDGQNETKMANDDVSFSAFDYDSAPVSVSEEMGNRSGQTSGVFAGLDELMAAKGADAAAALRSKLSALENAQQTAARTRTLPDGRVRYYGPETPARTPGPTRGASYVTEHNPATGQVRSWMESYDQAGNVTRVHPKMIDGQPVNLPHYPPTGKELGQ